jgi:acid phosphatase (class A)
MRRTLSDAALSTYRAKNQYRRARPFVVNKETSCTPDWENRMMTDGSYPSGHAAFGWAWALILCEIDPEHTDAILARGLAFGQSRVICGVHWQSDVIGGVWWEPEPLHDCMLIPRFGRTWRPPKPNSQQFALRLKPTRDCRAEAEALLCIRLPLRQDDKWKTIEGGEL